MQLLSICLNQYLIFWIVFGIRPFRGAEGGGENKNVGHMSGTPQLGLQTGGAGHNLGSPVETLLTNEVDPAPFGSFFLY